MGDESFREERKKAWDDEIYPALETLNSLDDPKSPMRALADLRGMVDDINEAQWWIEEAAQSAGNEPARFILTEDVRPVSLQILDSMRVLMAFEVDDPRGGDRKRRLQDMADFRAHFQGSFQALLEHVDSGTETSEQQFFRDIARAANFLEAFTKSESENMLERETITALREGFAAYMTHGDTVIAACMSDQTNIALSILTLRAAPLAEQIMDILELISAEQAELERLSSERVSLVTNLVVALSLALMALMSYLAIALSGRGARRVTQPIESLALATERIAGGDYETEIPPLEGIDELHRLSSSFRKMQESIRQSRIDLQKSERLAVLGRLTAMVSHELRNPLGTIRASLFSIQARLTDSEKIAEPILARAERGVDRCDRIVGELTDFAREKSSRSETIDLDEWLRGALGEMKIPAEVELTCHLEAGHQITFDPFDLRRCVINVVDNACHAMMGEDQSSSDRRLHVQTRIEAGRALMEFADTGPGISPEDMEKVFEPLYSTKSFGLGLGLPIVKQIMDSHGGGVELSQAEAGGLIVTLWLPLQDDSLVAGRTP